MGGPIAQLLWRRHPGLVAGLVLCATSANVPRDAPRVGAVRSGDGRQLRGRVAAGPTDAGRGDDGAAGVARSRGLRCGAELLGHDWTRIVEAGREICRFDSRPWVHELSVPTAVIATTADDIVPPHRQLALADAIPNATLRLRRGRPRRLHDRTAPVRAGVGRCVHRGRGFAPRRHRCARTRPDPAAPPVPRRFIRVGRWRRPPGGCRWSAGVPSAEGDGASPG